MKMFSNLGGGSGKKPVQQVSLQQSDLLRKLSTRRALILSFQEMVQVGMSSPRLVEVTHCLASNNAPKEPVGSLLIDLLYYREIRVCKVQICSDLRNGSTVAENAPEFQVLTGC